MEKTSTLIHNVFTNTRDYLGLKTRSLKLQAFEISGNAVSGAVNGVILAVIGFLAFVFINVGIAYALSEAFNSVKWGFLCLGGIYLVIGGIFIAAKNAVDKSIKNKVITKMSKDEFHSFEVMVQEKQLVDARLERAETLVKGNIEELKTNAEQLAEDFKKLKEDVQRFRHLFDPHHSEMQTGTADEPHSPQQSEKGGFQKLAMTTLIELFINRFVIKDVQSIKKVILPVILKAFMSTKMAGSPETAGGEKKEGFLNLLKSKLEKFI